MATRTETITHYTDDLDGGKAEGTVAFTYDGTSYEIDLSKKNKSAFDKAVKPYVDGARKVRATRRANSSRPGSTSPKRTDLAEIREWAKANGHEVSDRGRISQAIQDAFDAR